MSVLHPRGTPGKGVRVSVNAHGTGRSHGGKRCRTGSRLWLPFLLLVLFLSIVSTGIGSCVLDRVSLFAHRMGDRAARFRNGRYYAGRTELLDPSPKCCVSDDCLAQDGGRHAVITSLRTDKYLPLVQELACSLQRSNPGLPFYVYTVPGDLSPLIEDAVRSFAELRYWSDFRVPNYNQDGRFSLNWVKLRAWELEEFDAVLVVDSDFTVAGNLSAVFALPTPFAAVPDQMELAPLLWYGTLGKVQGGLLFLRPCRAVAEHMMALVGGNRLLQYSYDTAEQDFLDWYFKFDRWMLPLDYNSVVPMSVGNRTLAGNVAKAIHFTRAKPFQRDPSVPQHRYLCSPGNAPPVVVNGVLHADAMQTAHAAAAAAAAKELADKAESDCAHRKQLRAA